MATFTQIPYFWYLVGFWQNNKNKDKDVRFLIDLNSKINAIHSAYAIKLGFYTKKIDVNIQKINGFYLDTFKIVIVDCLIKNK